MRRSIIGWLWVLAQVVIGVVFVLVPWSVHGPVLLIVGAILTIAGAAIVTRASRTLGSALTPTPVPRPDITMRTHGLYARVRHPIYTGVLTLMLGMLVAAGTAAGIIVWVLAIVFFLVKARWEDALLHERFGADWEQWSARTGSLLPRLRRPD